MPSPTDSDAQRAPQRRGRIVAAGVVVLVAMGAGTYAATRHSGSAHTGAPASSGLTLSNQQCAPQWRGMPAGPGTLTITNHAAVVAEVLMIDSRGRTLTQIETVAPGTTASAPLVVGAGKYRIQCLLSTGTVLTSPTATVTGTSSVPVPAAIAKATDAELQPAADAYQTYVDKTLATLATQAATLETDIARGKLTQARTDWLDAQLTWCAMGAAYGSFGQLGDEIDGLAQVLPNGVNTTSWEGLHRIEYGLWHGQSAATLKPVAQQLQANITALQGVLPIPGGVADTQRYAAVAPSDLPVRAHEILEDTLRDRLSGQADYGSGTEYEQAAADVAATKVVLGDLTPMLDARTSSLVPEANADLSALNAALNATKSGGHWQPMSQVPQTERMAVNGTLGAALEVLADVPQLLGEVDPHNAAVANPD
ncbi:EfeM/EfeO family lipoprotein [Rudaeicoccus suwonensis]|uniref:EfeM/EfeO family lipoprotein n=1 Tax=Rudaeicoccus suwonensis TaxID=657409 RepID=UPI0011A8BC5D|nr:EfeM/EfeO family lipoprotein [Rudaeicoccus suwonensis]